jgi:hypothetical protein
VESSIETLRRDIERQLVASGLGVEGDEWTAGSAAAVIERLGNLESLLNDIKVKVWAEKAAKLKERGA